MATRVTFKSNWTTDEVKKLDTGVLMMATDIHRRSAILAPRDSGNLISSGRIKRNGTGSYSVIYGGHAGGFNVAYALRRHFENKKNPQTLRYLERAAESVSKGSLNKYFRGVDNGNTAHT